MAASVFAVLASGSAPASAEGSFRAIAAADGARLTVIAINSPGTNVPIDGGGPVAQASLDSLGTNQSFASLPYPGDAAISGPGLVAGVTNGQVTPPNYPFYVSADYPIVPEQKVEQPGYVLKANATERQAAASAQSGGSSGDNAVMATSATARSYTEGDTVTADAASISTGLAAGPLTIGRVTATASISRLPDGTLDRKSLLDVSLAKVGDVAVSITPKGVAAAGGANAPIPDSSAFTKSLADAGVSVKYLAGRETEGGLVTPTLEVSWTRAVPGPVSPVTVIWTLPRAIARIDGGGGFGGAGATTAAAPESPAPPIPEAADAGASSVERVAAVAPPMVDGFDASVSSGLASAASNDTATFTSPAEAPGPAGQLAGPATAHEPLTTQLASPAGVLQPPTFDLRDTFAVLALALAGAAIVSRRWRPVVAANK